MKNVCLGGLIISGLCLILASCKKENELDDVNCSKVNSTYTNDIKPIIAANCNISGCHNQGSSHGDFTTYSGLKAKVDDGSLRNRVIENKDMPPSAPLPLNDLKKIQCWLNSSAPNN